MAGVLDTARFRSFIAEELDVSSRTSHALVLGGHGDAMVPLPRHSTVGGIPLTELLPQDKLDAIVKRTRNGGAEIVGAAQDGSAPTSPRPPRRCEMAEAILKDKKQSCPARRISTASTASTASSSACR